MPRHDRSRYAPDSPGKCPGESGSQAIEADLLNQVDYLADRHGILAELLHEGRDLVVANVHQDVAAFRHLLDAPGLLVDVPEDLGDLPAPLLRPVGRRSEARRAGKAG